MDILNKIEQLRLERGWSVYKLAEECEITPSTIANMFARKTLPSITTLIAICRGFNISLSEFFAETLEEVESIEEKTLLKNFRKLSKKNKDAIKELIKNVS